VLKEKIQNGEEGSLWSELVELWIWGMVDDSFKRSIFST
jgi:hypothetical protein